MASDHKARAGWAMLAMLSLAGAAYAVRETAGAGWMPPCVFRKVTGLECAGCGMTRGTHALLNGRVAEAFAFNPVGMVLFPLFMVAVAIAVIAWVMGKPLPPRAYQGRGIAMVVVGVLLAWWVVRNFL